MIRFDYHKNPNGTLIFSNHIQFLRHNLVEATAANNPAEANNIVLGNNSDEENRQSRNQNLNLRVNLVLRVSVSQLLIFRPNLQFQDFPYSDNPYGSVTSSYYP